MEIEFSQKMGQSTLRLRFPFEGTDTEWFALYQKASELWQSITEYELSLLPENEQPGSTFKKLKR